MTHNSEAKLQQRENSIDFSYSKFKLHLADQSLYTACDLALSWLHGRIYTIAKLISVGGCRRVTLGFIIRESLINRRLREKRSFGDRKGGGGDFVILVSSLFVERAPTRRVNARAGSSACQCCREGRRRLRQIEG